MKFIRSQNKNTILSEENVLKLLNENGYISTAMIQRKFTVSYALAAKMIDVLAEKEYVKHDGRRWIKAR